MSLDAAQITIAGTHQIYVAPFGTTLPDEYVDPITDLDPAFASVGYTTEEGTKWTDGKTISDVRSAQSFYPVRKYVVNREGTLEATLQEWDRRTIELAFGAGGWTEPSPGSFVFEPPDPEDFDEISVLVDVRDGTNIWQVVVEKAIVVSNTESTFTRTAPSLLPVTFGVVGTDGAKPWRLLTNSDAASFVGEGS